MEVLQMGIPLVLTALVILGAFVIDAVINGDFRRTKE